MTAAVARIERIRFFKGKIASKARFHVSLGHSTVMATVTLFGVPENTESAGGNAAPAVFDFSREYPYLEELEAPAAAAPAAATAAAAAAAPAPVAAAPSCYVLLEFDAPVVGCPDSLVIGSRLDADIHLNTCRLAFQGHVLAHSVAEDYQTSFLPSLKIFKIKERRGAVDRLHNEQTLVGRDLFKKETQLDKFVGLKVVLSTGDTGVIEGAFGQSGKFKMYFRSGLGAAATSLLAAKSSKKKGGAKAAAADADPEPEAGGDGPATGGIAVMLQFKKYIFDPTHALHQS
jgi:selenocysteine-specific elongation factor